MIPCQRDQFTIPDDVAYFNCAYTSPLLKSAAAIGQTALNGKTTPWGLSTDFFFRDLNANRALFAALVGANPDDVAIIPSVSYGIALAARNLPVEEGQTIVVLQDQFPSNIYSWHRLARERGAGVVPVPRPGDGKWTPAVLAAITPQTALAALPNCHWTDGTLVDLKAVAEKCRTCGATLVVDGTQSLGAMPFSVPEIQPDFLITTAHKWLLGPYSYGFCYVSPRWQEGRPLEENWLNRDGSEDFARLVQYRETYQDGAKRFDAGEASNFFLAPIAGAALRQILSWGVDAIAETLRARTDAIAARATALGFEVAPAAHRAPHLIGLRHPRGFPADLPARLAAANVYASARGDSIRIAPHVYNTDEDVARLFRVLQAHVAQA
jgi:selenocysteine lyase/cysteine desulfurase